MLQTVLDRLIAHKRGIDSAALILALILWVAFLANPTLFGAQPFSKSPLAYTVVTAGLLCVMLAMSVQWEIRREIPRLFERGVIDNHTVAPRQFLAERGRLQAALALLFFAVGIGMAAVVAAGATDGPTPAYTVGAVLAAWLVGGRFAAGIAWCSVPIGKRSAPVRLLPTPGHPDGAAGFGHLGNLYFGQSLIFLLPVGLMGFWWLSAVHAIGFIENPDDYSGLFGLNFDQIANYLICPEDKTAPPSCTDDLAFIWRDLSAVLIVISATFFSLASMLPLVLLHRAIKRGRELVVTPMIDILRCEAMERSPEGVRALPDANLIAAHRERLILLDYYVNCPSWPLAPTARFIAAFANLCSLLGLMAFVSA